MFKNGDSVKWTGLSFRYIGIDPYDSDYCFCCEILNGMNEPHVTRLEIDTLRKKKTSKILNRKIMKVKNA